MLKSSSALLAFSVVFCSITALAAAENDIELTEEEQRIVREITQKGVRESENGSVKPAEPAVKLPATALNLKTPKAPELTLKKRAVAPKDPNASILRTAPQAPKGAPKPPAPPKQRE